MTPFLALSGMFQVSNSPLTVTLDQALYLADISAFQIMIQSSTVEKQHQAYLAQRGALGPNVALNGTYTRFDQESTVSLGAGQPPIVVSPIQTTTATATLTLPIDISGNTRRLVKASKANLLAQKDTLEATRNDTRQQVRTAYYAILRAKSQIAVSQEAVTSETENVRTTQLQFEQGSSAKIDVLTAEAQLSQSKSDLITAQNTFTVAKEAMNNALARKIESPIDVADVPMPPEPGADENTLTSVATKERPEAKALLQTREALAEIRRAAEQGLAPTLDLSVVHQRNIDADSFGTRPYTTTGVLAINWPIYDAGVTRAKVNEARQDEIQAKIQYDSLILSISLEVRQAVANMVNAKAKLAVADDQVKAAQEALRLAKLKQQQGEGIYLETLNAQSSLTTAELGQVSAKYDYLQAVADLQHAVGKDKLPEANK